MKRALISLVVTSLAFAGGVAVASADREAPSVAISPAAAVDDSLATLNREFRGWYADRRAEVLADQPLALVVSNSGVVAVRGDDSTAYSVDLTGYNQVKALTHGLLGYQGLMRVTAASGADANWTDVETFLGQLQQARALIAQTVLPSAERARARSAYDTLIRSVEGALAARSITVRQLRETLRTARPGIMPAVVWIGRHHAKDMEAALLSVRRDATDREWASVVAVVTGPMTARRDNLETAVAAKVLGPELLGSRIFYSENLFSVPQAMSYLGTVLGDSQFSVDTFDSPTRMWRDLFAPVSKEMVPRDFYTALAQ